MFAYCGNNYVNFYDEDGFAKKHFPVAFYDNLDNSILDNSIEETPNYYGTFSYGISMAGGVGPFSGGLSIFVTTDAQGGVAFQCGFSGGGFADENADQYTKGITSFMMVTNAPSYKDLEEDGIQYGLSTVIAVIDYVGCLDDEGNIAYSGVYIAHGVSEPGVHVSGGKTITIIGGSFDWNMYYDITQY